MYVINYINKDLYTISGFDADPWNKVFEIGKNGTMIVVYTRRFILEIIKDNPDQEYHSNKYDVNTDNISDVFSIGNIEDEWRFVIINDTAKTIHFLTFSKLSEC